MAAPNDVISPITIANYGKIAWDGISQNNPFFKTLLQKGNINRNVGGTSVDWPIEAGRHDVYYVDNYEDVTAKYTPRKRYVRATIPWGQVATFRAFDLGMFRQNSGDQALVRFRDTEVPAMFRDLFVGGNGAGTQGVGYGILNTNGSTYSGTGLPIYGLPSIFTGNNAISWSAGAKEGTIANTSYAGLSCVLSGLSSSVDGVEPDAWTPTAVNTTSTAWAGGAGPNNTFRYNAFEILNYAIGKSQRFSGSDRTKAPTCGLLTFAMMQDLNYQLTQKQTIFLSNKVGKDQTAGIGINTNEAYHNGLPFMWDENLPASTGYILNFDQMWLDVQPLIESVSGDKAIVKMSGDDSAMVETQVKYNDARRAITVSATWPGQFRAHPRYQTLLFAGA